MQLISSTTGRLCAALFAASVLFLSAGCEEKPPAAEPVPAASMQKQYDDIGKAKAAEPSGAAEKQAGVK